MSETEEPEKDNRVHIGITEDQKRISLRGPYGFSSAYRRLAGTWNATDKAWLFPLSMDSCHGLRNVHGSDLVISKELAKWAWAAIKAEQAVEALVKSTSADLEHVAITHPALAKAMETRTYQQVGAKFIAQQRHALIADEPGLGKTLEAIAGLVEANCWRGLILVCAPLTSLRPVWLKEITKFAPDAYVEIGVPSNRDSASHRIGIQNRFLDHYVENPLQPHVLVVNPEMLRKQGKFPLLEHVEWQAIIIDESHRYLSGIKSAKQKTQTGEGLTKLKLADDGVKVALSGTPMRGRPSNLWGTLHWLLPNEYTSFYRWADRYFLSGSNHWSSHVYGDLHPYRIDSFYKSLDPVMLRRTKAEVVKELPAKQRVDIYCDMTNLQEQMYKAMAADAVVELMGLDDDFGGDGDNKLSAIGVLAIMTRLKQFADCTWRNIGVDGISPKAMFDPIHSGKAAIIEQMLIERGIAGPMDDRTGDHKIVIASQFTQVIDSFEEYLNSINVPCMKITGAVRESERVAITEQFQSDGGPRVLLMNTMAGGVSITLDAYCDELVIIDETWTPDDQEQLEDRIHRVSRIHQVTIYRLTTKDSIDDYIKERTFAKDTVQKMVLDGRRGVDNLIQAIVR